MSYIKFYIYKKQYSTDSGQTWSDVSPLETSPSGNPIGNYSTLGECEGQPPQYRTTSGTPYCEGYDKYVEVYSQVSYDGGITWSTTATTTTLVEHNSQDCGYVPPTPFDGKIRLSYSNGNVYSAACNSNTTLTSGETRPAGYTYSAVTTAAIGSCVTSMANSAFTRCISLTSVTIPNSVTFIGAFAFDYCTSLTSVAIPDSVTNYLGGIFEYCRSLTSCTIGSGVTEIGSVTFYQCSGLTRLNSDTNGLFNIPSGVTYIGSDAFHYCTSLTSITIPSGVTYIGAQAFTSCSGLTSVEIPDGVTSIAFNTFEYCRNLTSCTIGSGVTSIGNNAFNGCTSLANVTVKATTPPTLGIGTFTNTGSFIVYVPTSAVDAYRSASGWSSRTIRPIP